MGMGDHFDICRVFEMSKFDIVRLTCILILLRDLIRFGNN